MKETYDLDDDNFELTALEKIRDDAQAMIGYNPRSSVYEERHESFYDTMNNDMDVDADVRVEVSQLLSDLQVQEAYNVLEEEVT